MVQIIVVYIIRFSMVTDSLRPGKSPPRGYNAKSVVQTSPPPTIFNPQKKDTSQHEAQNANEAGPYRLFLLRQSKSLGFASVRSSLTFSVQVFKLAFLGLQSRPDLVDFLPEFRLPLSDSIAPADGNWIGQVLLIVGSLLTMLMRLPRYLRLA